MVNRDLLNKRPNSRQARQQRFFRRQERQLVLERNRIENLEVELNAAQEEFRAELEADYPAPMATRGPNLAIPEFSGQNKENFDHWLKQFELLYAANNWNDTTKPQVLGAKLRGRAFMLYDGLPDATKSDYTLLIDEMKRIFKSSDRTRYVTQQYETRKQKPEETVSEFGCALYDLGLAALSDLPEAQRDSLIRIKFMEGLQPDLALWVSYANPKNFQEAMTLAERIEGLQHKQNPTQMALLEKINTKLEKLDIKEKNESTAVQVAAIQPTWAENHVSVPTQNSMENTMDYWNLVRSPVPRGDTGQGYRGFRPRFSQRPGNFYGPRQSFGSNGPRCYTCNRQGHISRNCPRGNRPLICQLCNRVGHMARDCQRRQQPAVGTGRQNRGVQWHPNNNAPNRNAGQFGVNRTMAIQYQGVENEDEQLDDTQLDDDSYNYLVGGVKPMCSLSYSGVVWNLFATIGDYATETLASAATSVHELSRTVWNRVIETGESIRSSRMPRVTTMMAMVLFILIQGLIPGTSATLAGNLLKFKAHVHDSIGVEVNTVGLVMSSSQTVYLPVIVHMKHPVLNPNHEQHRCHGYADFLTEVNRTILEMKIRYSEILDPAYNNELLASICEPLELCERSVRHKRQLLLPFVGLLGLGGVGLGVSNHLRMDSLSDKVEAVHEGINRLTETTHKQGEMVKKLVLANENLYSFLHETMDHVNGAIDQIQCEVARAEDTQFMWTTGFQISQKIKGLVEAIIDSTMTSKLSPEAIDITSIRNLVFNEPTLSTTLYVHNPNLIYQVAKVYPVHVNIEDLTFGLVLEIPVIKKEDLMTVLQTHNSGWNDVAKNHTYKLDLPMLTAVSKASLDFREINREHCYEHPGLMYCEQQGLVASKSAQCLKSMTLANRTLKHCSLLVKQLDPKTEIITSKVGVLVRTLEPYVTTTTDEYKRKSTVHGEKIKVPKTGVIWKSYKDFSILHVGNLFISSTLKKATVVDMIIAPSYNFTSNRTSLSPIDWSNLDSAVQYTREVKALANKEVTSAMDIGSGFTLYHLHFGFILFAMIASMILAIIILCYCKKFWPNCLTCKRGPRKRSSPVVVYHTNRRSRDSSEPSVHFEETVDSTSQPSLGLKYSPRPFRVNGLISKHKSPLETKIMVHLDNQQIRALFDTGSALTIVPKRIADRLQKPIRKAATKAVSMTGHQLKVIGEINATLSLRKKNITGPIVVVEDSAYDLIIGTDVIQQLGRVEINYPAGYLKIYDHKFSIEAEPEPPRLRVLKSFGVKACTTLVVLAACVGLMIPSAAAEMQTEFKPNQRFLRKYKVDVSSIRHLDGDKFEIQLTNKRRHPVIVPANATLGEFSSALDTRVNFVHTPNNPINYEKLLSRAPPAKLPEGLRDLKLTGSVLEKSQKIALVNLLVDHNDVFSKHEYDLGETNVVQHSIDTGMAKPIKLDAYRLPHSIRPMVSQKIQEMLEHKIIQPSTSPWGAPVTLPAKKDGTRRFCVDHRQLNDVTIKDSYPMKRIDDVFDILYGAKFFGTLDLQSGYWQVPIRKEDQPKTAFVIDGEGLFEFRKMSFGLTNAPACFQRLMETVLVGLDRKICICYLDDVIIFGRTFEEYLQRLNMVLQRLRDANLKVKMKKCEFAQKEVKFLGFVISAMGLSIDPTKSRRILEAKPPTTMKQLKEFVGFITFNRRFAAHLSKLVEPLNKLMRKGNRFYWSKECDDAFEKIKLAFTKSPILAFPDVTKNFIIHSDASGTAIGYALYQESDDGTLLPIEFAGRTLQGPERRYSVIEKEALAIYSAVHKQFRHYVYGKPTIVYTDHKPLTGWLRTKPDNGRLGRWAIRLQEYDLKIIYKPGKDNLDADYLSRLLVDTVDQQTNAVQPVIVTPERGSLDIDKLRLHQSNDPFCERIRAELDSEPTNFPFAINNGILYHVNDYSLTRTHVPVLPKEFYHDALMEVHDHIVGGGHLGIRKTFSKLRRRYYWPTYYKDTVGWVKSCTACQTKKNPPKAIRAAMKSIPVRHLFERWGLDILGPLPPTRQGNRHVVVLIEYLTKFPEAFPVPDVKTERIARIFAEKICCRYGVPAELITDQGANLTSELMKGVCKLLDVKKLQTTAYHPQTDGQTERFMGVLTKMISQYCSSGQDDWDEFIPFALFAYRCSEQESTKESPFYLMYGEDPVLPMEGLTGPLRKTYYDIDNYKEQMAYKLRTARELARSNIVQAQERQKRNYDQKATTPSYLVGDKIFLHVPAVKQGKSAKLSKLWKGPYRVMDIGNDGRNLLIRPLDGKRNNFWVHVNRTKPAVDSEIGKFEQPTEKSANETQLETGTQTGKGKLKIRLRKTQGDEYRIDNTGGNIKLRIMRKPDGKLISQSV